jgi:D-alanyl-D-alanine carboxypeptidase/D-alanyl-D-alanine-endopeptidase (penicillin-binding protein 4)
LKQASVTSKRLLVLLAVVIALLGQAATASAAAPLRERLDRALTTRGVARSATGALAIELASGRAVYGLHSARSLRPASTQKLAVALAALDRLGTTYRISTRVLGAGSLSGSTWLGRLFLKGYGDPSLSRADLGTLARRIRALGIRKVTGRIFGDESFYDRKRVGPGWKPAWYKIESPPLSALVVARAKVRGRTVDQPARAAAAAFRAALVAAGVDVARGVRLGTAPDGATRLAGVRSRGLSRLVRRMNKASDNFYAEMLLKHLGVSGGRIGTTRRGSAVVRAVLNERGVPLRGVRIADGSGLSVYDRTTARTLAALLVSAWSDPGLQRAWVASLPIAGVDGTLKDRMRREPAYRTVRAKTGTTARSSSLAGYAGQRYVFAILQNGRRIPWWNARRAQDRFAQILAGA